MCERFLETNTQSFYAGVRGQVYEAYAHRKLCAPHPTGSLQCVEFILKVSCRDPR